MTLEDKLREILEDGVLEPIRYGEGVNPKDYFGIDSDELIAQIKQAFQDEGYIRVKGQGGGPAKFTDDFSIGTGLMTGQEWYDRFETELSNLGVKVKVRSLNGQMVIEAAKKAAGL